MLWLCSFRTFAGPQDPGIIVTTAPVKVKNGQGISQVLQYKASHSFGAQVQLSCYQLKGNDSTHLYHFLFKDIKFEKGFNVLELDLLRADSNVFVNESFLKALRVFDRFPAGIYKTCLTIIPEPGIFIERTYLSHTDSTLSVSSHIKKRLNKALSGTDPSRIMPAQGGSGQVKPVSAEQLDLSVRKINRRLRRTGVTTVPERLNGKMCLALYYEGWFLGRYELASANGLEQKIAQEYHALKTAPASFVSNNLEDFKGVSFPLQELFRNDEDKYLTGNVDLNACFGNGQEPGSLQADNYLELRGDFQMEVLNMPIAIEGYYTTQDKHRQAKASYLRVHYDVQQSKDKLAQMIHAYKNKYAETAAKGKGLEAVYQGYVRNLKAEELKLNQSFSDYGIDPLQLNDPDRLFSEMASGSLTKADSFKDRGAEYYREAAEKKDSIHRELREKYMKLQQTRKTIEKYTLLLEQYRDQLTLDSGLVYSKLEQLQALDEASYKDMAKAASGILPEGGAKKFIYGLTHLDLGIINQYESEFTASGQTLKGGSAGYDFGFVKAGITIGKTEYISREGTVDPYSSTTLRGDFKPFLKQKLGLVYYTYSPSASLSEDEFFKEKTALPSFQKPVHIVSVLHEGALFKHVSVQNEIAASYKKTEAADNRISLESSAIKTAITYAIPKTSVNLNGEWEHVGKDFQNSSLPYIRAATERYTLSVRGDFFKSFLSAGVQYNHLKQETFSSTGYSTKWGFDIKTNSKRYPNLYVSYKPFSTFRAYNDTFSIQQRPLAGEVWIVKGSYQIKKKTVSHRFLLIYNENSTSAADTQNYHSRTLQVGYIYLSKANVFNLNTGWMQQPRLPEWPGMYEGLPAANSYFIHTAINRNLGRQWNIQSGQELSVASYGLQRLSATAGIGYSFEKIPLTIRLQGRYSQITPEEPAGRKNLWQGQAGLNWRFKTKLFSKHEE